MRNTSLYKQIASFFFNMPFVTDENGTDLKVGDQAPLFELPTHQGERFNLEPGKNATWTVLYFYPKAGTPLCTSQACSFRNDISLIHELNADVFGISTDKVNTLHDFHRKHQLNFTLLSDADAKVTEAYGVKMPILNLAKRWTFILDPSLIIRHIDNHVEADLDGKNTAERLQQLQQVD